MKFSKPFKVINKSEGRVVHNAFSLEYGGSKDINPVQYSEDFIKAMRVFESLGHVAIEPISEVKETSFKEAKTIEVETEFDSHTIFNPEKASELNPINTEVINDEGKAVELDFNQLDREEALGFLSLHWKTIEKDLAKMTRKKELKYLLSIASENGLEGTKKYSLIEDRLKEL